MKTVLRPRPATLPEDNSLAEIQKWCNQENRSNKNLATDLEDEFSKIGAVKKWTPVLTYATPGNLAITYSTQMGDLMRTKEGITASFFIVTSAYSFTTASGTLQITGLPYTASTSTADANMRWVGSMIFGGITKANYTQFDPTITAADNVIKIVASGSGQAPTFLTASDVPTGGAVILNGTINFRIRS